MRMRKQILSAILAGVVIASSVLAGCGSAKEDSSKAAVETEVQQTAEASDIDISKEVELVMYAVGSEPNDFGTMMEEFNKMLKEDLNATLKVKWIGWSDWKNQYPLILSSGENIDIIYTATWLNFYQQAQKGAFLPLEELLPVYAPNSWAQTSEGARYQATVDGHIYCVPTGKSTYSSYGAIVRGDLMEKYNLEEFHDFEGYANYMKTIAENEPGMQPSGQYSAEILFDDVYMMSKGLYCLNGSTGGPYWIDPSQEHPTVFTAAEWDGFPEFLDMMNEWFQEGFWPASALANQDDKMLETGKAASKIHNIDTWATEYTKNPDWDLRYYDLVGNINTLSQVQDAIAIPVTAKNPERELMLLDKWRTEQKYFDLFTYGIPGVHSEILEDGSVKGLNDDLFNLDPCSWGFRTDALLRDNANLPSSYEENMEYIRSHVVENKYRSFFVDTEAVKNEYAAVQNVMSQYYDPLVLGYTDKEAGLEELKAQLSAAGNDKIKEELQKQLDSFIESYGK